MKYILLGFLIVVAAVGSAFGQSVLQNADVVGMVKAGLSESIIAAKIRASDTNFDTSTDALANLSKEGVPESVVVAMVEKQQQIDERPAPEGNMVPEQGSLADIVGKTKVFISAESIKARDRIAEELEDDRTFTIVDKIEDSEFVLFYDEISRVRSVSANANTNGRHTSASARNNMETVGNLIVAMPSAENPKRPRLLYQVTKVDFFVWDKPAARSTVKQFLKDFKKVVRN